MRSDWKDFSLKDVLAEKGYIRGPFGSALRRSELLNEGIPVYEQQHAINNTREFRFYINERKFAEMNRFAVMPNDIIISRSGTVGKTSIISSNDPIGIISQALLLLRVNDQIILPEYLKYFFQSQRGYNSIIEKSSGSVQVNIAKRAVIEQIQIPLPPLKQQEFIVSILKSVDKRIEINKKLNDDLVQQAMAIFNDRYDSAAEQCPFTSLIHVLGGGTPKTGTPEFWNGDILFFTPKDIGSPYTFQTEKMITATGLEHCNSRLYPENTTFVTARGTVGKVSLAGKPMAMNQSCYALASDSIDPILVYFYTLRAVESLKHKASGAVFDAIVTRDFETEVVPVIPADESKAILALIAPMVEAIHTHSEESIRLAALRDALLPRLMSGEIDVSSITL